MTRFSSLNEIGTHSYSAADIAIMTDAELIEEINRLDTWDADLLADLIWRAFPDFEEVDENGDHWQVGDTICYEAAEKLGFEI